MIEKEPEDNLVLVLKQVHRWRMAFFGLVILLAGVTIGVTSMLFFTRDRISAPPRAPEKAGEHMMGNLVRKLGLSEEQAEQIKPIVKKHMQELREIRMNVRPEIIKQLQEMNTEVSSLLDSNQKEQWQQHFNRLRKRFGKGGGFGRHGSRHHRFKHPPPPTPEGNHREKEPMRKDATERYD